MHFEFHDLAWLLGVAFGALNAWQNKCIHGSILELKMELGDRIAKAEQETSVLRASAEGDVRELRALFAKPAYRVK